MWKVTSPQIWDFKRGKGEAGGEGGQGVKEIVRTSGKILATPLVLSLILATLILI